MQQSEKDQIFKVWDNVLVNHHVTRPEIAMRLIVEYQLTKLFNIEKANNEQQRVALYRTLNYTERSIEDLKKGKKDSLSRVINFLCLHVHNSNMIKEFYRGDEIMTELNKWKSTILEQRDWYLRTIPESKWLMEYLDD